MIKEEKWEFKDSAGVYETSTILTYGSYENLIENKAIKIQSNLGIENQEEIFGYDEYGNIKSFIKKVNNTIYEDLSWKYV